MASGQESLWLIESNFSYLHETLFCQISIICVFEHVHTTRISIENSVNSEIAVVLVL